MPKNVTNSHKLANEINLMNPAAPSDAEIVNGYAVTATRISGANETLMVCSVSQSALILSDLTIRTITFTEILQKL